MNLDVIRIQALLLLQLVWETVSSRCSEAGFTESLLCSTCDDLPTFNLHHLLQDCKECCQNDAASDAVKFLSRILGKRPQCAAFIKSPAVKNWPGLEVKYVRGADPTIKLIDEDDEVQETLNIEAWNTDSIMEFLDERLAK